MYKRQVVALRPQRLQQRRSEHGLGQRLTARNRNAVSYTHLDVYKRQELELLYYLASHPNRVFTRDQLLDEVWGFEYLSLIHI